MADDRASALRVLVVGAAYLVQGSIAAVGTLLLVRLAQLGAPLEDQGGVLASGALPWVLKLGFGVALDLGPSWSLRRRAAALTALQLGAAACVAALAQIGWNEFDPSAALGRVTLLWFALNLCAAGQDVLVDALALDTLADRRPATATAMGVGVTLGFNVLGLWIVGGRVVAAGMGPALRWPAWGIAVLALVPLLALWRPGVPAKARARAQAQRPTTAELAELAWIPPLFVALTLAPNLTQAVGVEFLFNHLGWDYLRYASVVVPIASLAAVLGSLAIGPIVAKLGPARAGVLASMGLALAWLGFAAVEPLWTTKATIAGLAGLEGGLQSAMIVAAHALALVAAARTPLPTAAFVLAMASLNLARVIAPLLAPHALALGWVGLFAVCGAIQALAGAGVWPLRERAPRDDRAAA